MKTKQQRKNKLKNLKTQYNFCFHLPTLKILKAQIDILEWVEE